MTRRPVATRATPPETVGEDLAWLNSLIDRARRHAEVLSDGQIRFVDHMTIRTEKWGERMFFSAGQRRFAEGIERELDRAGVPRDPEDWG